jgi:hypothetical protein
VARCHKARDSASHKGDSADGFVHHVDHDAHDDIIFLYRR